MISQGALLLIALSDENRTQGHSTAVDVLHGAVCCVFCGSSMHKERKREGGMEGWGLPRREGGNELSFFGPGDEGGWDTLDLTRKGDVLPCSYRHLHQSTCAVLSTWGPNHSWSHYKYTTTHSAWHLGPHNGHTHGTGSTVLIHH